MYVRVCVCVCVCVRACVYQLCLSVCKPLVQRRCQRLYRNQYGSWVIWSYFSPPVPQKGA